MLIKALIVLGLIITPFIVCPGYDTRDPKMAMALVIALTVGLLAFYKGELKSFKNKWISVLLIYLLASLWLMPKPSITIFSIDISNFFVWQPLFYIIVFYIFLVTVSSINTTGKTFIEIMVWCGFVMAIYCLIQACNLDQFFGLINREDVYCVPMNKVGGTMGQPTVVASFLAMLIPLALYLKKCWKALVMIIAVIITQSQVAWGAMFISLLFYYAVKGKQQAIISLTVLITVISLLFCGYTLIPKSRVLFADSGRFETWKLTAQDITTPLGKGGKKIYPLTGIGLGSFKYIFHTKHNDTSYRIFFQAHNEYMEFLFNCGMIGLFLLLGSIYYMWKINFSLKETLSGIADRYRMALLSSFLCIAICAGGSFVWQLGAHIFYTIVIAGLLHNKEVSNA